MAEHTPGSHRTSLTVEGPDQADRVIIDLTESGVDRSNVSTHPVDTEDEADGSFVRGQGKAFGRGWLAGFLLGAVLGALIVAALLAILYEPPWSNGTSAAITLGAALGIGYIVAGIGFLRYGIARAGETGAVGPGGAGAGSRVEVVVDAIDASQERLARQVFQRHTGS